MRKLKLQMQMSVDGFVAGPNGELDWMTWNWDDALKNFVTELTDSVDAILLGRKMTDGFIGHWSNVRNNPEDESYEFAAKMMNTPKTVFSRTLTQSAWENTDVANDINAEVKRLKTLEGKGIVAYGGAGFVSSLVENDLIDDYYIFVNPAAIGEGLRIFTGRKALNLIDSTRYDCGVVVNHFQPVRD